MVRKINRDELRDMICSGQDIRIVDVLERSSFNQEHIKGAISLPLAEIETKADKALRRDDKIVVYCASFECQASTNAAEKLMSMGFKDVWDYKGGIKDYKEAGFPLEGALHRSESKSFPCSACAAC